MSEKIREALACVPSDDRATWVMLGMALKSELGESGREIWDTWSRQSESYKESSAEVVWKSFKASGGVTINTLFHFAIQHGWTPGPDHKESTADELQARRRVNEERDREAARLKEENRAKAAKKARYILDNCHLEQHAYLESKGWKEMTGLVWRPEPDNNLLVIPMLAAGVLIGCQMIDRTGAKKFLGGQRSAGAEFVIGQKGRDFVCEGYATGLSVRDALAALKIPARIHVCFSDSNMVKIGKALGDCFVIADNDVSRAGHKAAEKIGMPFWMSEREGEDFNDFSQRVKLFKASQSLRAAVLYK